MFDEFKKMARESDTLLIFLEKARRVKVSPEFSAAFAAQYGAGGKDMLQAAQGFYDEARMTTPAD